MSECESTMEAGIVRRALAAGAVLVTLGTLTAGASGDVDLSMFTAPDAALGNQEFGWSLAVDGTTMIIGAPGDDELNVKAGAAYVAEKNGDEWIVVQKLFADDGNSWDRFGTSVGISGDVVVVSAPKADAVGPDSGAVYVYRYDGTTWLQEQQVLSEDLAGSDQFGRSVAIDGNLLIAGAPFDSGAFPTSGSAYVFEYDGSTWNQIAKLHPDDPAMIQTFGSYVSLSGDRAAIAADNDSTNGSGAGAAYVFEKNGANWAQAGKLLAPDGQPLDKFGSSIDISGDTVIVGAPYHVYDSTSNGIGVAYTFRRTNGEWAYDQMLTPGLADPNDDEFGAAVAVDGDVAVVGAPWHWNGSSRVGAAYTFERQDTSWIKTNSIEGYQPTLSDFFGAAAAVSGTTIVVGAYGDDDGAQNAGSVSAGQLEQAPPPPACAADVDGNGAVDQSDLAIVLGSWGAAEEGDPADMNGDGEVNPVDLSLLLAAWGACPEG